MGGLIDLTGQRFGRLTVIGRGETYIYPPNFRDSKKRRKTAVKWICRCDCGNTKEFFGSVLKSGKARSCGCLRFKKTKMMYEGRLENEKA